MKNWTRGKRGAKEKKKVATGLGKKRVGQGEGKRPTQIKKIKNQTGCRARRRLGSYLSPKRLLRGGGGGNKRGRAGKRISGETLKYKTWGQWDKVGGGENPRSFVVSKKKGGVLKEDTAPAGVSARKEREQSGGDRFSCSHLDQGFWSMHSDICHNERKGKALKISSTYGSRKKGKVWNVGKEKER